VTVIACVVAEDDDTKNTDDPKDTRRDEAATVRDLEHALRFVHLMGMQGRLALEKVEAQLAAMQKILGTSGAVDEAEIIKLLPEELKEARARLNKEAHVDVGPSRDKYAVEEPDVDCAGLMHLCKGRCCRLTFSLSFQDLDEGVVKWTYDKPYRIRQRASDGYCVHNDEGSCTVYQHRPAVCRVYDCRHDQRVWIDFENKIPAPLAAVRNQPVLVERIGLKKPESPADE
jgi:hypothetical protein